MDGLLLTLVLGASVLLLGQVDLHLPRPFHNNNNTFPMFLLGVYRIISEHFYGRSAGRSLTSTRVRYLDGEGVELQGAPRLFFVVLRNSWLLVVGLSGLWFPESDPGAAMLLLFLTMLFNRERRSLMDLLARARVVDTKL